MAHVPEKGVARLLVRRVAHELEVLGGRHVDHHRAFDGHVADAEGSGGVARVELRFCVLEESAHGRESVVSVDRFQYVDARCIINASLVSHREERPGTVFSFHSQLPHEVHAYTFISTHIPMCRAQFPPAMSLQYFRWTGSTGTPANSSMMHLTRSGVLGASPPSSSEREVCGTSTRAG
jgi:hypothetical protein